MEKLKSCPVCGDIAADGVHDQVVLWGWGVHHAESNSQIVVDRQMHDMVILHVHCFQIYIEGKLMECRRK